MRELCRVDIQGDVIQAIMNFEHWTLELRMGVIDEIRRAFIIKREVEDGETK